MQVTKARLSRLQESIDFLGGLKSQDVEVVGEDGSPDVHASNLINELALINIRRAAIIKELT